MTLRDAWALCRILDDVDDDGHWDQEVARAAFFVARGEQPAAAPAFR